MVWPAGTTQLNREKMFANLISKMSPMNPSSQSQPEDRLTADTEHIGKTDTLPDYKPDCLTESEENPEETVTENSGFMLIEAEGVQLIPCQPESEESQPLQDRERTISSSSSDSAAESEHRRRLERSRKSKARKNKVKQTVKEGSDDQSSNLSCPDCQTDLTDSDVEVCHKCFGMRKVSVDSSAGQEYCPFPFNFVKKKYAPVWMYEPEYTYWHPRERTRKLPEPVEGEEHNPVSEEIHRHTDSLFSTSSNFTNYRGLLNLCLILLVLSNARLCIENLIKYGVLINPLHIAQNCFGNLNNWPNVKILTYQGIHPLIALGLEYFFLSKSRIPESVGVVVNAVNGVVQLTYPAYIVLNEHPNPVFSSFTLAIATVLFLKLISYAHVNYWCRYHRQTAARRRRQSTSSGEANSDNEGRSGSQSPPREPIVEYPDNLTLKDMAYFVLAPTLCYELNFPRSARIRKRFLIKRIVEMVFLIMVIIGLVQQWIVPTISNSIKPLSELDPFRSMERLLKLSVPNHFIWLMFFYAFFHSMLNVLAEVLMFGDRDFYQDWWNAETISQFWKSWNIPVHRWATRHIYKPMRKRGFTQMNGSIVVFIVSAFFHEYLVSVPLRMFKVWAFSGMVMQIPLAMVTGKFFEGRSGNILMWLSLILGQPIAILAYVHDYYVHTVVAQNGTDALTSAVNETLASALHTEL